MFSVNLAYFFVRNSYEHFSGDLCSLLAGFSIDHESIDHL